MGTGRTEGVGLDAVELIMAIEEEFDLEIPNERAAKIFTVGDLHAYLISELGRLGRADRDDARVYARMRDIICRETAIEPAEVVPSARFIADLRLD
jgi:acyl carrier protein